MFSAFNIPVTHVEVQNAYIPWLFWLQCNFMYKVRLLFTAVRKQGVCWYLYLDKSIGSFSRSLTEWATPNQCLCSHHEADYRYSHSIFTELKHKTYPGLVIHICKLSTLGSWSRRVAGNPGPVWANDFQLSGLSWNCNMVNPYPSVTTCLFTSCEWYLLNIWAIPMRVFTQP